MPFYEMHCQNEECLHSEDFLMKWEEMKAGVNCPECGSEMKNKIRPVMFKPCGGRNKHRIIAPDVGPNSKKSRAYQKKMDEANSLEAYKPGGTFGTGGINGFKERQVKAEKLSKGETNFTK